MLKRLYVILLFFYSFSFSQELSFTPSFKTENRSELGIGYGILGWDKDHQMWSISKGEIISFDGSNSRSFKVPLYDEKFGEDGFGATYLDLDNERIVIATLNKLTYLVYDIVENKFTYFENEGLFEEEIYNLQIYPFEEDKYFVATYGSGVLLLNLKSNEISSYDKVDHPKTKGIPSNYVKSITRFDDNTFVFGFFHENNKKAVIHFLDTKKKRFYPLEIEEYFRDESDLFKSFLINSVRIVHKLGVDEQKNLIVATYSCLLKLDTKNKRIYRITANKEVDETVQNVDNSLDFIRDDKGLYWVITANSGIMLVDLETHAAKYIQNDPNNESSIASNYPSRLRMDPDGNIWVTHRNSEVINVFDRKQRAFDHHDWNDLNLKYYNRSQQNIPISSIYVHNDSMIFISSGNGLHLYNPKQHKDSIVIDFASHKFDDYKQIKGNIKLNTLFEFAVHDGKIYFAKAHRFYVYDIEKGNLKQLKNKSKHWLNTFTIPLFFTPQKNSNTLYFSSYYNVFEINTTDQTSSEIGSFEFKDPSGKRLYPTNTKGVQVNEQEAFIQVGEQNLGKLNLKTLAFENIENTKNIQSIESSSLFFQIQKVKDSILATTENGFISISSSNEINYLHENIDFGTDRTPISFTLDNDTVLYFTTLNEINRLNLSSQKSTSYGKIHGLKIDRFLSYDVQKDQHNNLYFISTNGLVILDPEKLKIFEAPFNVELASIITEVDTSYFSFNSDLNLSKEKEFNTDVSFISFKLRTNQSYTAEQPEFFYRLNKDGQWVSNGTSNEIRFSGLGFGNYILEIKGVNALGVTSDVQTYNFIIKTPFWLSWWFISIIVMLLTSSVFGLIKYRERKIQEKNRVLEGLVAERTKEVVEQKDEAELQRKIVEEKNKEILDSIQYAKRIQSAILPPNKLVKSYLNDSFILYLPKDVVAGDFYWIEPFDNGVIFAAADCTGHGVPGAMVSVVCNNGLNRSVREYKLSKPADILDKTREIVVNEFEKSEEDVKDGMDISLVNLYTSENDETFIEYAGANNPLWVIRKGTFDIIENEKIKCFNLSGGEYSLLEVKADKQPIGKYDQMKPFTNHKLKLKKGDAVYLFSDGLVDQFGGENLPSGRKGGKKYKPVNLRKLLFSIHDKEMDEQKTIIEEAFFNWKGELEQVDDVCIIGVCI